MHGGVSGQCDSACADFAAFEAGCQHFWEFFFHSSCTEGSLLGCRVSGATFRQPCLASKRYTTECVTGRPKRWASAARSGATISMPPSADCSAHGFKNSRSSCTDIAARRRPPHCGSNCAGYVSRLRTFAWYRPTLARPTPSAAAVCSKVAFSSAGNRTAWAHRRSSSVCARTASPLACSTTVWSTTRGLAKAHS